MSDITVHVHYSQWAQQPDILILCTDLCTSPTWGPACFEQLPDGVYEGDAAAPMGVCLYTFLRDRVTCPDCKKKIVRADFIELSRRDPFWSHLYDDDGEPLPTNTPEPDEEP